MGYTIPEDNTRIYVQTGMRTTPEHALQNAQAISQIVKEPEGVIVNGTQGFAKSVLRSTTKNTNANYLAKPQTQSIMFEWKSKQKK
jgi:hypothetical protein